MRLLISAVVTAIALFFLGFLWWGILMPIVRPAEVITDQAVIESMSETFSESGLYFYPDYAEAEGASKPGPMVIAYFYTDQPAMGPMMGAGFGHMLVTALLVSWIVSLSNRSLFVDRVKIVAVLGWFVALWADVGNMIWWRHPPLWTVFHIGYDLISWLVAGLIIAAIVKPVAKPSAVAASND